MFEATHVLLGQVVALAQARPAVGAVHELIAEAKLQLRVAHQV